MASTSDLGGPLTSQVQQGNGVTRVALSGNINEATSFAPLLKLGRALVIDLSKINRINSLGVRNWMDFVKTCEKTGIELTFEHLSPSIVSQISMISNFMGSKGTITSLHVPYRCPACNRESTIDSPRGAKLQLVVPCPHCKQPAELDDVPEAYDGLLQR